LAFFLAENKDIEITLWSTVLFQKLIFSPLFTKFPVFRKTREFITVSTVLNTGLCPEYMDPAHIGTHLLPLRAS
jgi:hypothetical protein